MGRWKTNFKQNFKNEEGSHDKPMQQNSILWSIINVLIIEPGVRYVLVKNRIAIGIETSIREVLMPEYVILCTNKLNKQLNPNGLL